MTLEELKAFSSAQLVHMKAELKMGTQLDYQRILKAAGADYIAFLRAAPNTTFVKRKCAILWQLRALLIDELASIEAVQAVGGPDQSWPLQRANVYADLIREVAKEVRIGSRTQAGKSKKVGLKSLSKDGDFRTRLIQSAGKAGRVGILILAVTGLRPAELERGVHLKASGEHFVDVRISGAKHTETTGHETRVQRHDARKWAVVAKLLSVIREAGGRLFFSRKADSLRDDIKAAGARANLPSTISPYSLRHQFKSDLQASGWSRVDIARAMGHASTRTGGHYGRKRSGRAGTTSMVQVIASGVVREPMRTLPKIELAENTAPANEGDLSGNEFNG